MNVRTAHSEITTAARPASVPPAVLSVLDVAIGVLALCGYLATLSATPAWDALRYAAALANGATAPLAGAHHPLGTLLGAAVHRAAELLGWHLEALAALQVVNAVGGALAVGAMHTLLRRAGARPLLAAAVSTASGASLASWEVATDGEGYGVAAGALMIALAALPMRAQPTRRQLVLSGAVAGLAILAHQLNAVVLAIAASAVWWRSAPARGWIAYLLGTVATLGVGYALAWHLSGFAPGTAGFAAWLTFYVQLGFHFPPADRLSAGPIAFARSILAVTAIDDLRVVLLLAVLGSVVLAAVRSVPARARSPLTLPLAASALVAAGLAIWWEPDSHKFWVPALLCTWAAIGLRVAAAPHPPAAGVAIAAAALAMWNLALVILPRHDPSTNPYPAVARQIAAATDADDLIVVGTDILAPSLAYFGARPKATNLFALAWQSKATGHDGRAALGDAIAASRAHGARAFISSDAPILAPDRRALLGELPTTLADLLPNADRVPVLQYRLRGSNRTLFEIR